MIALRAAQDGVANLPPGSFGIVMATGIVSLAAHLYGWDVLANLLFWLNLALWAVLWVLNLLRLARYPRRVFADMADHMRGPGYFTVVAATAVLAGQFVVLEAGYHWAVGLAILAFVLWMALIYTIFALFTLKSQKPTLDRGINGSWLLAVVATQSLAVIAALLAARSGPWRLEIDFFALSMWLWGGMLYIWVMVLIFYRYTFFLLSPEDLTPPYWINMGAMAISTLAGSLLIANAAETPLLESMLPFIKGFTVFYWATGTWWVPMLLLLGAWRYLYKRFPMRYETLYWGAVFPLGMYAVCTRELARELDLGFLIVVGHAFFYVALAAWTLTLVGLVHHLASGGRLHAAVAPARRH